MRLTILGRTFCAVTTVALASCAVKPLPEDVTRLNTYKISQKVRCEMRDALRQLIIRALARRADRSAYAGELAQQLQDNPDLFINFDKRMRSGLPPKFRQVLDRYNNGAVGYEFTFTISEQNIYSGSLGLGEVFTRGPLALSVSGSADKLRKNTRNFIVVDNLERLVRYYGLSEFEPGDFCASFERGKNLKYPIVGELGMSEFARTFFSLNEFGNLTAKDDKLLADTMEFTTTLKAGAKGGVELTAVADALKVTSAMLSGDVTRIDNHKLILTMALPGKGRSPTTAEQRARAAIFDQRQLEIERNTIFVGSTFFADNRQ